MKRHSAGTYNIEYTDGDKEVNVPAANIRRINGASGKQATTTTSNTATTSGKAIVEGEAELITFKEGERVECNEKGKGSWYVGIISAVRDEEPTTYNVEFDDPALFKSYKVPSKWLRHVIFKEGDRVECNEKGKGSWYVGIISAVRDEEPTTYNVEFDDKELFKSYKVRG